MMMMNMECVKESGSGWSIGSGIDPVDTSAIEQQQFPSLPPKKKRFHRHTTRQIQQMEAYFNENPNPEDKQRKLLSQEIGLTNLQIKFWFQNRRNQIKVHKDRIDNVMLKAENEALKKESFNLQSDLRGHYCSSCRRGSVGKLRLENARLREEINMYRSSITSLMNPPLPPSPSPSPSPSSQNTACFFPKSDLWITEEQKPNVIDFAVTCLEELTKMCEINEEYYKKINGDRSFRVEASKAKSVVMMNSLTLVNAFLDAEKWLEMFCSIVTKAKTIQIVCDGVCGGGNGSLLLMYAELQAFSPLIPTREAYFLRYAQHNINQQKWIIVDFPIDRFFSGSTKPASSTSDQYRRKPSGCIIQELPNGYSKVTWVEHVEVEEKQVTNPHHYHEMVREYMKSGLGFGANRWLDVLKRQCERMVSLMATKIIDLGVIPSGEARRNLMKLSQRMVKTFCLNINTESKQDTVRITTRKLHGDGGLVPCGVYTTFLPYSHHQVFNLLRLSQMFNENSLQEVAHIANGSNPGNCISLLRIIGSNVKLMLQESCTDNSGSLVVYSAVDVDAMQLAMNGEDDPLKIPLLPLGFSVVPLNPSEGIFVNSCLLTVGIQVSASDVTTPKLDLSTVAAINNRICSTVYKITTALGDSVVFKQEMNGGD